MPTPEELERRFTYHAPDEQTRALHDEWRTHEQWYAQHINDLAGGETREKSLALTALEEATFWVHAHIARNLTAPADAESSSSPAETADPTQGATESAGGESSTGAETSASTDSPAGTDSAPGGDVAHSAQPGGSSAG